MQRTIRRLLADNDALLARLESAEMKERWQLLQGLVNAKKHNAALEAKIKRLEGKANPATHDRT